MKVPSVFVVAVFSLAVLSIVYGAPVNQQQVQNVEQGAAALQGNQQVGAQFTQTQSQQAANFQNQAQQNSQFNQQQAQNAEQGIASSQGSQQVGAQFTQAQLPQQQATNFQSPAQPNAQFNQPQQGAQSAQGQSNIAAGQQQVVQNPSQQLNQAVQGSQEVLADQQNNVMGVGGQQNLQNPQQQQAFQNQQVQAANTPNPQTNPANVQQQNIQNSIPSLHQNNPPLGSASSQVNSQSSPAFNQAGVQPQQQGFTEQMTGAQQTQSLQQIAAQTPVLGSQAMGNAFQPQKNQVGNFQSGQQLNIQHQEEIAQNPPMQYQSQQPNQDMPAGVLNQGSASQQINMAQNIQGQNQAANNAFQVQNDQPIAAVPAQQQQGNALQLPAINLQNAQPQQQFNAQQSPAQVQTNAQPQQFNAQQSPAQVQTNAQAQQFNAQQSPAQVQSNAQPQQQFNAQQSPAQVQTNAQPQQFNAQQSPAQIQQNIQPQQINAQQQSEQSDAIQGQSAAQQQLNQQQQSNSNQDMPANFVQQSQPFNAQYRNSFQNQFQPFSGQQNQYQQQQWFNGQGQWIHQQPANQQSSLTAAQNNMNGQQQFFNPSWCQANPNQAGCQQQQFFGQQQQPWFNQQLWCQAHPNQPGCQASNAQFFQSNDQPQGFAQQNSAFFPINPTGAQFFPVASRASNSQLAPANQQQNGCQGAGQGHQCGGSTMTSFDQQAQNGQQQNFIKGQTVGPNTNTQASQIISNGQQAAGTPVQPQQDFPVILQSQDAESQQAQAGQISATPQVQENLSNAEAANNNQQVDTANGERGSNVKLFKRAAPVGAQTVSTLEASGNAAQGQNANACATGASIQTAQIQSSGNSLNCLDSSSQLPNANSQAVIVPVPVANPNPADLSSAINPNNGIVLVPTNTEQGQLPIDYTIPAYPDNSINPYPAMSNKNGQLIEAEREYNRALAQRKTRLMEAEAVLASLRYQGPINAYVHRSPLELSYENERMEARRKEMVAKNRLAELKGQSITPFVMEQPELYRLKTQSELRYESEANRLRAEAIAQDHAAETVQNLVDKDIIAKQYIGMMTLSSPEAKRLALEARTNNQATLTKARVAVNLAKAKANAAAIRARTEATTARVKAESAAIAAKVKAHADQLRAEAEANAAAARVQAGLDP